MRAVRDDPALWGGVVLGAITALAQGVFQVTFVVFVLENLHGSPADVGILRGLIGVGTIAGGLTLTVLGPRWSGRSLTTFGLLLMAITAAAAWNGPLITTNQNYYRVVFMLIGIPGVAAFIGVVQILQRRAPRNRRGRIFSLLNSVMNAGEGAGLLIGGLLADRIATTTILNGHVALLLLAGIIAAIVLRDRVLKPTPAIAETTVEPVPEPADVPVTAHD
jgi:predicted MFS family arabinose efflux permease